MKLFNTLSQSLEEFKSLEPKKVTIYVCGITPYDTTHLGHAFTYISFDALIRFLKFKGYEVEYTQNVTDINDRDKDILQRAKKEGISWQELSKYWTKKFLQDMKALNWTPPTNYLYASQQIKPMIDLIQKLLDRNYAYLVNGSAYLEIKKFPNYGILSGFNHKQMIKVAKEFEEDLDNSDKKDALDITLWRASEENQRPHIPSFDSPWGKGRPGWHLECSAMSTSTLGERIDIHGGGSDLIFPHHEAEIAQSEGATGKIPFVKYWMHTGQVAYKGVKMSKSKKNLVMVSDLLKKYSPNAIRWLLLSNQWNKNWEFFEKVLENAQKNVVYVENSIKNAEQSNNLIMEQFTKVMDNNLNTPKVLELLLNSPSREIYKILGFKNSQKISKAFSIS